MAVHGHKNTKPLQCKTCGKRFLTNSALGKSYFKHHLRNQKIIKQLIEVGGMAWMPKRNINTICLLSYLYVNQQCCTKCVTVYAIFRREASFKDNFVRPKLMSASFTLSSYWLLLCICGNGAFTVRVKVLVRSVTSQLALICVRWLVSWSVGWLVVVVVEIL